MGLASTRPGAPRRDDATPDPTTPLLPLAEVMSRLPARGSAYVGVRTIEVDRIVGSLDRSVDFDRRFRPRRLGLAKRLRSLEAAFSQPTFPPITVVEAGGAYFVADGHHRVAWCLRHGVRFIEAEITRLDVPFEIGPDVDVRQLVHTQHQERLHRESGLAAAVPDVRIEVSRPNGYDELLEIVRAHGFERSRAAGRLLADAEVAADWYAQAFRPTVEAALAAGVRDRFPYKRDGDLYHWLHGLLRQLRLGDPGATVEDAARLAGEHRAGPLFRWRFLRGQRRPLPRRAGP